MSDGRGDADASSGTEETGLDSGSGTGEHLDESAVEVGQISPSKAFSILANETRIEILQALWECRGEPLSFSELLGEVDVDRGNFNYHLSKLATHFVQRTDDGYRLREAGEQVVRAVLAGTITSDPSVEPTDLGVPCPLCGNSIEFSYADEYITVRCTACSGVLGGDVPPGTFMHHAFPPAGLRDRTDVEVFEAARIHYETDILSMLQGVCPECGGRVDRELHVCDTDRVDEDGLCRECESVPGVWVDHTCENCAYVRWCTLWLVVLFHPVVISFVYERRPFETLLELRRLFWTIPESLDDINEEIVSRAPLQVEVTVPFDGDEIAVTVNSDLETVDVS